MQNCTEGNGKNEELRRGIVASELGVGTHH
jgi:hypothetical protein